MNKKLLVSVFLFFFVFSLTLFSQEESKEKKIWEDERISITVDKVERVDSFPDKYKLPNATYLPPNEGCDFVFIHVTIVEKRDLKTASSELKTNKPNCPHLINDRGETHWAGTLQFDITTLDEGMSDRDRDLIFFELQKAKATLEKDERFYKRMTQFFEEKLVTGEQFEEAKAQYDKSKAQHQAVLDKIFSLPIILRRMKGYVFFEMPKYTTPVQLTYVYPYREKPPKASEIKFGQIDIDLSHVQ